MRGISTASARWSTCIQAITNSVAIRYCTVWWFVPRFYSWHIHCCIHHHVRYTAGCASRPDCNGWPPHLAVMSCIGIIRAGSFTIARSARRHDAFRLLRVHLAVLLDRLDVLVALEGRDGVVGEGNTVSAGHCQPCTCSPATGFVETDEKPLMSEYSCPMVPPWSLACCLALYAIDSMNPSADEADEAPRAGALPTYASTCSGVASSLQVTYRARPGQRDDVLVGGSSDLQCS